MNDDVRQCLIYDAPTRNARLIGVEYMVTPRIYESFDEEERKLWHSHVYEVKSGMLVMPKGTNLMPERLWEEAETKEMETVVGLYGKTYHFWRVERGDAVPLGPPQLMMSYTQEGQLNGKLLQDRDERFRVDIERKKKLREHIDKPTIHPGESDSSHRTTAQWRWIADGWSRCGWGMEGVTRAGQQGRKVGEMTEVCSPDPLRYAESIPINFLTVFSRHAEM